MRTESRERPVPAGAGRKKLTSSGTGGLRHTVELLQFCAEHGITANVEVLPPARSKPR